MAAIVPTITAKSLSTEPTSEFRNENDFDRLVFNGYSPLLSSLLLLLLLLLLFSLSIFVIVIVIIFIISISLILLLPLLSLLLSLWLLSLISIITDFSRNI